MRTNVRGYGRMGDADRGEYTRISDADMGGRLSVAADVFAFHIVDKRFVDDPVSTRCGIVAREVPVAEVIRTGFVKRFNGLEDYVYGYV